MGSKDAICRMNDHWIYHVKLWEVKIMQCFCVIMFVHVLAGL